jgi:capsular exopolysaccharide synthesis family protein
MSNNFDLVPRTHDPIEVLHPAGPGSETPARGWPGHNQPPEIPRYQASDWERFSNILRKHWKIASGFALAAFLGVAVVTFMMKPVYEPSAQLEIDPPGAEIFSMQGNNALPGDAEYLQTQAQKIKSDGLALEVIRFLRLAHHADLVPRPLADAASPAVAPAEGYGPATPAENLALQVFRERVKVTRDGASRLVKISFGSHDPALAAVTTNKLVDLFIENSYRTRHDAIVKSTEWLSKQLDDIRERMVESERKLADFQRANVVADTGDNKNTVAEEITELNRQLTQAQADRIQLQAFLAREKEINPDTLPQVRSNPLIQQMTQKLADVRTQLAEMEVVYGKNHPNIKKLEHEARELETEIATQRVAILSELKNSYAAAKAREGMMTAQIKSTTRELNQLAQYTALKKEVQANTDLYNSLYAKVKEAGIAAASKSSNMRVIDRARVLDSPTRPRRALNLAIGLLGGLIGGVFLAFAREGFDRRIHTVSDVKDWAGFSGVLVIPAIGGWRQKLLPGNAGSGGAGDTARRLLENPYSPEAEGLRSLHATVLSTRRGPAPRVLLVVSGLPGEGKTSIAVGLATALAQHARVCLIDADLRKPGVEGALGIKAEKGLGEVLSGIERPEQVLVTAPNMPNLTVIPAGSVHPDPAVAFSSAAMQMLLHDLRERYEFIVIDSAPALICADVRIISPLADGVLLVARSGIATPEAIGRTREILAEARGAPVLNVILNAASAPGYGYRYRYPPKAP